jgi:hypothetical protein
MARNLSGFLSNLTGAASEEMGHLNIRCLLQYGYQIMNEGMKDLPEM